MTAPGDYSGFMLFGYQNGKLAKVPLSGYETKTNRKKLINAYSDKSKPVSICYIPADCDIYLTRSTDKAMVLNTSLLSPINARSSTGVQVFTLRKNTSMSSMKPLAEILADSPENADNAGGEMEYYRVDKIPSAGHFHRNQLKL